MKWPLRIVASLAVAAVLLSILMIWGGVGPQEVALIMARLPLGVYFLALAMHVFTYCMRALRFRVLIPASSRPDFQRALVVAAAHNMASYTLPAKTGEASFVVYLRVYCGVAPAAGIASLLVSRFLDAAVLCLGLGLTCLWLEHSGEFPGMEWLRSVSVTLFLLTLLFGVGCIRGDLLVRGVEGVLRKLRLHRLKPGRRLLETTNSLALALRSAADGRRLSLAALCSVPIWFSVYGFFFLLARNMGMPKTIGFAENTFGASIGMAMNLLPLNAVAGVGTQELGWVTGFNQFLGVDYDVALSAALGVHLVQILNVVVLGLIGHLAMGALPRNRD